MDTRQRSRVNISPQRLPPPPPPPYTTVKHETSGKQFHKQRLRPPNYTPPPPYSPPPDSHTHTATDLGEEDRSCDLRQMEQCFVLASYGGGHIQCSSSSDRTQHLLELQKPSRNQPHASPSQSSGHEEKYQNMTKPRRRRRRRSEGTVLISHTKNIMGSSGSPDAEPLTCRTLPHLKSSTSGENQLEDGENSCRQLNSFNRGPTAREEPREEHQNHKDHNEKLRKKSPPQSPTLNPKISKHEDTNSTDVQDHRNPQPPTPEETHHQTIVRFPYWKEPRSSRSLLNSTETSQTSREGQCEQPDPRGTSVSEENMGLMLIDATRVLIRVQFISSTEEEPVRYVSSCPTVSSNKNHEQVRRSELMIIRGTRPTTSNVQPEDKTSEGGTETITSNRTEDQSSGSEDKAMLEISEAPHRNVVRFHTGHETVTNTRQDSDVQSAGEMFLTLVRNSSETFSRTRVWTGEPTVADAAEGQDLPQDLLNSYEQNTDQTFNQDRELPQENPPIICPNLQTSDSCSLWNVISRIRRHTAPDSETEEDQGDVGEPEEPEEPVEPSQDHLRETRGTKAERWELEERAGCSDSSSSSSVDSQDTVINTHTHTHEKHSGNSRRR